MLVRIVAPSRGRGLKLSEEVCFARNEGRPFTGAWIETLVRTFTQFCNWGRPFTGAWIETHNGVSHWPPPACRPFTGAWIETVSGLRNIPNKHGRPFTGAWIETWVIWTVPMEPVVAPSRGRGLKRYCPTPPQGTTGVAPSRGRGLKHKKLGIFIIHAIERRPFTGAWIETSAST